MSFELAGKLIVKGETQQVSERFKKREFVIEKEENRGGMVFTDTIKFQLTQDRCDLLDSANLNDELKVSFNIKGNRWEKGGQVNYFVNLDAWRIEKANAGGSGSSSSSESFSAPKNDIPLPTSEPDFGTSEEDDDLPF